MQRVSSEDAVALYHLERARRAGRTSPEVLAAKALYDADRAISPKERKQRAIAAALARTARPKNERPLTELQIVCAKLDDAALVEMTSGRWQRCV